MEKRPGKYPKPCESCCSGMCSDGQLPLVGTAPDPRYQDKQPCTTPSACQAAQ